MKIASISAELAPFSKTGGLGEVAKALPTALRELGHSVVLITPLHYNIDTTSLHYVGDVRAPYQNTVFTFSIWQGSHRGSPVYFLENKKYFKDPKAIYLTGFDNERFLAFNIGALELIKKIQFVPDIIQCHDWHTGLVPYFLKSHYTADPFLKDAATVFTIHNLAFQFEKNWWETGEDCKDDGSHDLPPLGDQHMHCINFALRAIMHADMINAVSENYAKEILTKEFGENLDIVLRSRREDLFGIINGVDYDTYNPATDPGLKINYDYNSTLKKTENKLELQRLFGLPQNPSIPVIGMVSRITEQKGLDIIIKILDYVLTYNVQVAIMGIGDKYYEDIFTSIYKEKYKNFSFIPFDQKRETLVYA